MSKPQVITGKVVISRSPCHLPSDVQCFNAVDVFNFGDEEALLSDHYNVIVFSSQGSMPQCKRLSNGDLDGDTYLAIWDQALTQHIDPNLCIEDEVDFNI